MPTSVVGPMPWVNPKVALGQPNSPLITSAPVGTVVPPSRLYPDGAAAERTWARASPETASATTAAAAIAIRIEHLPAALFEQRLPAENGAPYSR